MKKTYISLFSSAGVGCYGFTLEGFECIATNELIKRRLEVQKANNKCKYDSGYIIGDIEVEKNKQSLYDQVRLWNKKEKIDDVTVMIATPPCQGMSVANHKKNVNDHKRNSLVVESIKIVSKIKPIIFIFENVSNFLNTICTDVDGKDKPIKDSIERNLSSSYEFQNKVMNFKNFGSNSSRTRTLVIGVRKDYSNNINVEDLFPSWKKEKSLKEVIGHLPSLSEFHEVSDDFYHFFRKYSSHMRPWIENLKEGESAFDNKEIDRIPHRIIDGEMVLNKNKNGSKYTRQYWDRVAPCIHTRNDQLASQNTIHPSDDRVFSIRELMEMMTIPKSFKWSSNNLNELNKLTKKDKIKFLKKHEINIRQSIGEAVPTKVFQDIANKISNELSNLEYEN